MKTKVCVKVTFEDGDTISTWINLDFAEAKKYYLNNYFNLGTVEDNMQKAVKIEQL